MSTITVVAGVRPGNQVQVLLCEEGFAKVAGRKIYSGSGIRGNRYALIQLPGQGLVLLHRFLIGAKPGECVDHRDGNRRNNQLSNLRVCTHSQNNQNRVRQSNNTSGFKGVSRAKRGWRAYIRGGGGGQIHCGYYDSPEEAARAYDTAARALYGEFARTNFN